MSAPLIPVQIRLAPELYEHARALGPVEDVVAGALREALSPETAHRRRRWLEENALMIEAIAGGAEEASLR